VQSKRYFTHKIDYVFNLRISNLYCDGVRLLKFAVFEALTKTPFACVYLMRMFCKMFVFNTRCDLHLDVVFILHSWF
jgi:hypothetical protein